MICYVCPSLYCCRHFLSLYRSKYRNIAEDKLPSFLAKRAHLLSPLVESFKRPGCRHGSTKKRKKKLYQNKKAAMVYALAVYLNIFLFPQRAGQMHLQSKGTHPQSLVFLLCFVQYGFARGIGTTSVRGSDSLTFPSSSAMRAYVFIGKSLLTSTCPKINSSSVCSVFLPTGNPSRSIFW